MHGSLPIAPKRRAERIPISVLFGLVFGVACTVMWMVFLGWGLLRLFHI
jgi:hypothetical protein